MAQSAGDVCVTLGPYEINNIYAGQSEKCLAQLPDGCIDLTVTSPPYDNLRTYNGFTLDWSEIIRQLYRVTKPGGVVVWVVGDQTIDGSETLTSFEQALFARSCGFNQHDTMIYRRKTKPLTHNRYEQEFEYMFVWSKPGRRVTCNRIMTDAVTCGRSYGHATRRHRTVDGDMDAYGGEWQTGAQRIRGNIWRYNVGGRSPDHPAIFPEALARDHIVSWSNPGDLVLDPFMGSGTTAKVARQNGRHWLGFDVSAEYVEMARKRVGNAQPPLLVVA